ncbi:LysR family transcriptional regulator [Klebsiella sp. RHBSTW-00484]|uniref:LysR family transcriptional regulator n=1 Tax=unclassified Klebsiella TaxID=2608929 RepID=UPI0015E5322A|nr:MULTISPECIES: LysR family transcriptional regulator [unclassified Klebsiella]MBA7848140.1 LysR family transcriptional regulator [Klebsiella sp. RHBSTW-00465]QLO36059.1 LysR family transcriptional regulator [Klebsiella sp. RHBSTW-00484]QLT75576.1 LysR family transcriptional regulator [Klebsiella sp. RHBSTW-00464]
MNKFVEMSTFVAVVDALSFVGAAAKLGTTKSVVSQRVKTLELRLGASLLERGQRLSLTEAGLLFYQECVRILEDVILAEEAVAPARSELRGGLRIATSHTFMTTHLATILAEFATGNPGLSLDVSTEDRQVNMHQPDFDVAIRLGPIPDSTLIARTFARNLTWLCASPDYLARHGVPQHPSELEKHDGLLYTHRAPGGCWQLLYEGQVQMWRVRNRLRSDNAFCLLESAKAGMGIVVMPMFLGADAILKGELQIILADWQPDGGNIVALYRQTRRASPVLHALVNTVAEKLGAEPEWERRLRLAGHLPI